jgi:NACHT domain
MVNHALQRYRATPLYTAALFAIIALTLVILGNTKALAAAERFSEIALLLDIETIAQGEYTFITFTNTLDRNEPDHTFSIQFLSDQLVESLERQSIQAHKNLIWPLSSVATQLKEELNYITLGPDVIAVDAHNWQFQPTIERKNDRSLRVMGLKLHPGVYKLLCKVLDSDNHIQRTRYKDSRTITLAADKRTEVRIITPSLLQQIREVFTKHSGTQIGLFGTLLAIILAVTRKHIEEVASKALDGLGKVGIRELAVRRFRRLYKADLVSNHKHLRLVGFNIVGVPRPLLEEVYISLRVGTHGSTFLESGKEPDTEQTIGFHEAIRTSDKLVILGSPGAGKTTTLSYILLQLVRNNAFEAFKISGKFVPIFVPLRRLSSTPSSILQDLLDPRTQILTEEILKEYPKQYFERHLERGQCFVLFDGLDEVPSEEAHRDVANRINSFVTKYSRNRFIVTCRIAGWRNLLPEFRVLEADELSREEVHRFIRGWHTAVIGLQERNRIEQEYPQQEARTHAWQSAAPKVRIAIDDYSGRLINAIDGNPRILAVATNPMLLSLICLVHLNRNILPKGRPILYAQCIELLVDAWDRSRGFLISPSKITVQQKEAILRQTAYEFQLAGKVELPRAQLEELVDRIKVRLQIEITGKELIEDIERRSGLLVERSIDVLGFSHLTLQEYLAGRHFQLNVELLRELLVHVNDQEWREVTLLYAGLIDDSSGLLNHILKASDERRFEMAAHCIGEAQTVDEAIVGRVIEQLVDLLNKSVTLADIDSVLGGLAALAADYKDEQSVSKRQTLSRMLISWIENGDRRSPAAISIVGKARITRALPVLVDSLFTKEELRNVCIRALVLFGNVALQPIEEALQNSATVPPIEVILEPLATINTASSAIAIARLYERFTGEQASQKISLALATMLDQPHIETEVVELTERELPASIVSWVRHASDKWYSETPDAHRPYICLLQRIRRDLSGIIRGAASESGASANAVLSELSFRVMFPAFLDAIKGLENPMPSSMFTQLGFLDPASQNYPIKFEQLALRIKESNADLSTILTRSKKNTRRPSKFFDETLLQRVARMSVSAMISVVYLLQLAVCFLGTWVMLSKSAEVGFFGFLVVGGSMSYIILVVWRLFERRRRMSWQTIFGALLAPVQNVLEKVSYMLPRRPWLGYVSAVLAMNIFSFPAYLLMHILPKNTVEWHGRFSSYNSGDSGNYWVLVIYGSVFCGFTAWYYYRYVVNVSFASLLLSLHPKGVAALKRRGSS